MQAPVLGNNGRNQGIMYPSHSGSIIRPLKLFDTPPTPAPTGGVKSSYTPYGVHVILGLEDTAAA